MSIPLKHISMSPFFTTTTKYLRFTLAHSSGGSRAHIWWPSKGHRASHGERQEVQVYVFFVLSLFS
jgi:hypothetical protein